MKKKIKLNLGCGDQVPENWINVDYSLGARLMKFPFFKFINSKLHLFNLDWNDNIVLHDLTKTFPWKDQSVDVIYSSHTLEHLTKEEGQHFLMECYRVLKDNGLLRIVVPDLRKFVESYLNQNMRADDFVHNLGVLYGTQNQNVIKRKLAPFYQFPHKCMYDTPTLLSIIHDTGFTAMDKAAFDSEIEDISAIELSSRTENAVIIEGIKVPQTF
ncbi:class I SAM-dependent methyltransferase [Picosynechococcus sp. PCC 8807]|uniref:class I SAM-dependent methyltransferase n=1 Tax=Picosynechococcus sp. PCC 8807 TaxID=195248 RepID=UPI0008105D60|nr:methyltransferase domain-containing protein [Picosynechococcus sp. PCC 8807]ANV90850.1 methyltransferase type 11 [Picosynechococcus sp. PCC 8807]